MKFNIAIIFLLSCQALASDADLDHKIKPGYKPSDMATEQGIWLELEDYEKAIQRSALLVKDEEINKYVRSVACRVAGDYCGDLRIYILRNPYFNASMTANGTMQIWTGLLLRVSSEDELAAILGHELAHYTRMHTLDRFNRIKNSMSASTVFDFGLALFTGVYVPVGKVSAVADLMSFSREQENEADLLGVKLMAENGFDPNAAPEVWKMVVEEEEHAVVKKSEPGVFSKTHPDSEDRMKILGAYIEANYSYTQPEREYRDQHIDILNRYYAMLMEDQIDTNRYGRTESILERHAKLGIDPAMLNFYKGEMYRQRNEDGDMEKAKESYLNAISTDRPMADAYLRLGYMYLKDKDMRNAKEYFEEYLVLNPETDDRAMIEFYIKGAK